MSRGRGKKAASLRRRAILLAICVLSVLVGSTFVGMTLRGQEVARDAAALTADIALLETQRSALEAEVAARKTDAYVEQKARDLGFVRPGEGMAAVRESSRASANDTRRAEEVLLQRVGRWLALFFRP